MTGLNLILFLGAFLLQYLIGAIIDLWPPTSTGGYHPQGYQAAFGFIVVLVLLALGWLARTGRHAQKPAVVQSTLGRRGGPRPDPPGARAGPETPGAGAERKTGVRRRLSRTWRALKTVNPETARNFVTNRPHS